jgi:hypothetical protein
MCSDRNLPRFLRTFCLTKYEQNTFYQNVINLYQTTRRHIQEESILHRQPVWNSDANSFFVLFLRIKVTNLQDVMSCGCLSLFDLPFFHKYFIFVPMGFTITKHSSLNLDVSKYTLTFLFQSPHHHIRNIITTWLILSPRRLRTFLQIFTIHILRYMSS